MYILVFVICSTAQMGCGPLAMPESYPTEQACKVAGTASWLEHVNAKEAGGAKLDSYIGIKK